MEDGDWYGEDLRGGRIFVHIGHKFSSHMKVFVYHGVVSGVFDTHCHEYLSHGAELLLHTSL